MKLVRHDDYPRAPSEDGTQRVRIPGFNTRLLVCGKGCTIPRHTHSRSEEIFVLSGKVRFNDDILGPGDILRTEAGESHEAEALEDTRFLVMNTIDPN